MTTLPSADTWTATLKRLEAAEGLLRDVAALLRSALPHVGSKHKTLRAWALDKRKSANPHLARQAETTLAMLDLLGED